MIIKLKPIDNNDFSKPPIETDSYKLIEDALTDAVRFGESFNYKAEHREYSIEKELALEHQYVETRAKWLVRLLGLVNNGKASRC